MLKISKEELNNLIIKQVTSSLPCKNVGDQQDSLQSINIEISKIQKMVSEEIRLAMLSDLDDNFCVSLIIPETEPSSQGV